MMMLINDLFTIEDFSVEENSIDAKIIINTDHKIFTGHFPGQPVLPGVCMVELMKELTEKALNHETWLTTMDTCKFLYMVDPRVSNQLVASIQYTVNENQLSLTAVIKTGQHICVKLKAILEIEN